MKRALSSIIAFFALALVFSVQAHEIEEHMKDAENPDCAAMKNMDHSQMDMDDPVMQAMMKQCMQDMHHENPDQDEPQNTHQSEQEGSQGHQH